MSQNIVVIRDQVVAALRTHEADLRAAGVVGLSLFGSLARGEDDARDVDVAVRLSPGFCKPGLDYFRRLDDLERRLSELLGCPVDVIEEPVRNPRFQHEIDRDRTVAF
jgi:predicted nucleotidyltransferase